MIDTDPIQKLHDLLAQGISSNLYTAVQCVVASPNSKRISISLGKTRLHRYPSRLQCPVCEVNDQSLFDLASLTKPLATTALVMKAMDEGILEPHQKIINIVHGTLPSWLMGFTLEDLLTHSTPLIAWADFHHAQVTPDSHDNAVRRILAEICRLPPRTDIDVCCYSDLGFIILGYLLELCYAKPLNKLFLEKIALPLHLEKSMMYLPLHHTEDKNCVATHPFIGGYALQGHPDDDNTRAMVHVAGHAGLFATANAIADYVDALLGGTFPVSQKMIDYLEGIHEHYGEIFRERFNGNFNCEIIAAKIGKSKATVWRWSNKVTSLAIDYYFRNNF